MRVFFVAMLSILPAEGHQATDPSSKLCFLLDGAPGASSLKARVISNRRMRTLTWITGEAFTSPPPKQCAHCLGRGIPHPAGAGGTTELIINIIGAESREGSLWSEYVNVKSGALRPNSNSFGDGPALDYKDNFNVLISFPLGNYRVNIEAAPSQEAAARAFASHLDRVLRSQPPPCPSADAGGNCDVASIKPAELTSPSSADLKDETVRFTWSPGNLIRDYQLSVDVNPGGAGLGNIGPGKITSAGVKMPDRETPIYVTLRSFPQCGGGPPLPKSYTFRYPGPPSIK